MSVCLAIIMSFTPVCYACLCINNHVFDANARDYVCYECLLRDLLLWYVTMSVTLVCYADRQTDRHVCDAYLMNDHVLYEY